MRAGRGAQGHAARGQVRLLGGEGRPDRGRKGGAQPGVWRALTPLSRSQTLLQLHALELQGIQLPLDVLHLPLDLGWHVVRVQLGTRGW